MDNPVDKPVICVVCGFEMEARMCKITCPNCGARIDCSDVAWRQQ